MQKDQRELLLELTARHVKFPIVGGYAYSYYIQPRAIKDLDVYISTSDENVTLLYAALAAFGAPLAGITPQDFQSLTSWFQVGTTFSRVDTVQNITAVDFDSAWEKSEPGFIDGDIPVRYISFEDLVANKLAVGIPRDLADVAELRAAEASDSLRPQKQSGEKAK